MRILLKINSQTQLNFSNWLKMEVYAKPVSDLAILPLAIFYRCETRFLTITVIESLISFECYSYRYYNTNANITFSNERMQRLKIFAI